MGSLPFPPTKAGEYSYEVEGKMRTGYTITLYHTPSSTTSVTNTVEWNDSDDSDKKRPDQVTLYLFANGEDAGSTTTARAETGWKWSFDGLAESAKGQKIDYTVT